MKEKLNNQKKSLIKLKTIDTIVINDNKNKLKNNLNFPILITDIIIKMIIQAITIHITLIIIIIIQHLIHNHLQKLKMKKKDILLKVHLV